MATEILLRYLHFICIFAIVSSLVAEHLLLHKELTRREIARLSRIDAVYGIAAVVLVIAGLILWLGSAGKPAHFYSYNWIFHLKLATFISIGLLSIVPTVFFIRNSKGNPEEIVMVPKRVFRTLRLELVLLFIIPLLAGLMAHGIGYFGE